MCWRPKLTAKKKKPTALWPEIVCFSCYSAGQSSGRHDEAFILLAVNFVLHHIFTLPRMRLIFLFWLTLSLDVVQGDKEDIMESFILHVMREYRLRRTTIVSPDEGIPALCMKQQWLMLLCVTYRDGKKDGP